MELGRTDDQIDLDVGILGVLSASSFKTLGNPMRKRGMSLELPRLQSLAHASGF